MTLLIRTLFIVLLSTSISALAHPGGHGEMRLEIDDVQAKRIAQSTVKAMTLKARGYSAGKIDASWNKVRKEQYKLVDESDILFLIKATNLANEQSLLFQIGKSGRVLDVVLEAVEL